MTKVGLATSLTYGSAALASSAKSVPIATLLMLYYNQVIGVSALTVSTILMVSLVLDACFDPLIGQLSDHCRSSWGRRLPFMYLSIIPTAVLLVMLWNPPTQQSQWVIIAHLALCLLGLRFFDTLFELPHAAAAPELTRDYDKRTTLFATRYIFEAAGGMVAMVLAYNVFMKENPDGSGGILSREGYPTLGLFCAAAVAAIWTASTLGLHRQLKGRPSIAAAPHTMVQYLYDTIDSLKSRSLLVLGLGAVCFAIATGIMGALNTYFLIFLFGFTQTQITVLFVPVLLCMAFVLAVTPLSRRMGKRDTLIRAMWLNTLLGLMPLLARLFDLTPAGSSSLLILVGLQSGLGAAAMSTALILFASMISDLVEEAEVRTGRRSEGLFLAVNSFLRKATQGIGTLGAGAMLTIVAFPSGAQRGEVPIQTLNHLGWLYVGTSLTLLLMATHILRQCKFDRAAHEANLRVLKID